MGAEPVPSREGLANAPPTLADFGNARFPLDIVLKESSGGEWRKPQSQTNTRQKQR